MQKLKYMFMRKPSEHSVQVLLVDQYVKNKFKYSENKLRYIEDRVGYVKNKSKEALLLFCKVAQGIIDPGAVLDEGFFIQKSGNDSKFSLYADFDKDALVFPDRKKALQFAKHARKNSNYLGLQIPPDKTILVTRAVSCDRTANNIPS